MCIYEEGQRDGERDFKLVIIFNSYLVNLLGSFSFVWIQICVQMYECLYVYV